MSRLAKIKGTCPKLKQKARTLDFLEDEIWHQNGVIMIGLRVPGQDKPKWSVRVKLAELKDVVAKL